MILESQIVVITGRAGCGKSLVSAQCALDFLFKKQVEQILVTRAAVEVGHSLGFLPGSLNEKFDPYLEAFQENLVKCYDKVKVEELISSKKVNALPVQFIRGKTVDDVLVVEEAQNLTKAEMLAIITRLGKNGKIIINGDLEQTDIRGTGDNGLSYVIGLSKKIPEIQYIKLKHNHRSDLEQTDIRGTGDNGLSYVIGLSKKIPEIQYIKLKHNHRSDLVGKILDFEYGK
jgi:phosphate starvation-inducible PhoH-like protein